MIFQTHSNINLTFWIFSNVISVKITVVKIVIKINSDDNIVIKRKTKQILAIKRDMKK